MVAFEAEPRQNHCRARLFAFPSREMHARHSVAEDVDPGEHAGIKQRRPGLALKELYALQAEDFRYQY
jgi:hypothetical protein